MSFSYVPSTAARTLRYQGTKTIGLIVPDNANPFFAEIAKGVENAGFEAGYSVVLCNSNKSLQRELEHLRMLQAKQVDGIIFIASTTHIDQIRPLVDSGIPVVMFYRDPGDLNVDTFKIDNQRAGYIATRTSHRSGTPGDCVHPPGVCRIAQRHAGTGLRGAR